MTVGASARRTSTAVILALVATVALVFGASAEDVYSERTMELARELQCPICSGQSVADSQVTLARQMRDVIEQKVQAGESDEQIIAYFTARYGEQVLLEPPRSGFNLTLWWIPPIVLAMGALVVVLYIREGGARRSLPSEPSGGDLTDEELESIEREFLGPGSPARSS